MEIVVVLTSFCFPSFVRGVAVAGVGGADAHVYIYQPYTDDDDRRDNPAMARGRFREFYQCDFDIAGAYPTCVRACVRACVRRMLATGRSCSVGVACFSRFGYFFKNEKCGVPIYIQPTPHGVVVLFTIVVCGV